MSWLRLDDSAVINPKIGQLTDRQFRALIALWSYCARRGNGGRFRISELQHMIIATPRGSSHVDHASIMAMITAGLVTRPRGYAGVLEVKDWAQYQPKDPTAAERMRRYRARKVLRSVTEGVSDHGATTTPITAATMTRSQAGLDEDERGKPASPQANRRSHARSPNRNADRNADRNTAVTTSRPIVRESLSSTSTSDVAGESERGWVENLSSYTGCRHVRGEHGFGYVRDVLGTDRPPTDWPYARPTRAEILKALKEREKGSA